MKHQAMGICQTGKFLRISICTVFSLLCSVAQAQQTKKVPLIGVLSPYSSAAASRQLEALRSGLHELGYAEGKNMVIIARYADGYSERIPTLAKELVRLKVDVIMTSTVPAIEAAMRATSTIPIVTVSADPVAAGLVASLARPGANVTGLSLHSPELDGKRLEILRETFPRISESRSSGIQPTKA